MLVASFKFRAELLNLCLVPMLQRGNPYGMHSHAGAWEREIYDGFVKSYIMPLCSTVTENNLSIMSNGYDLIIWKSENTVFRHSGESRNPVLSSSCPATAGDSGFHRSDELRVRQFINHIFSLSLCVLVAKLLLKT